MRQLGAALTAPLAAEPPTDSRVRDEASVSSIGNAAVHSRPATSEISRSGVGEGKDHYDSVVEDLREVLAALIGLPEVELPLRRRRMLLETEAGGSWGSGSDSDGNLQLYAGISMPSPLIDEVWSGEWHELERCGKGNKVGGAQ